MEINKLSLAIALPLTDDKVHTNFLDAFVTLRKPESFLYLRPDFPSKNLAGVRNALVKQAMNAGATHILMMDTDQTPEKDLIEKLLKNLIENDLLIVGGKVHRRYPNWDPLLLRLDKEKNKYYSVSDEEWTNNELVEVDATGCGCLLIDLKLFDIIPFPWFKEGELTEEGKPIGEDVYFCEQIRKANIPIFVNTKVKIGHLGLMNVNEHFYFLNKMLNEANKKKIRERVIHK